MKSEHIQAQLKLLKPVLVDPIKAKKKLEKYWSDKVALVWTMNDIHTAANKRGKALTRVEAKALLDDLSANYNPQYGLKWVDLWDLIEDSGYGRKLSKREVRAFVEGNTITIEKASCNSGKSKLSS